MSDEARSAMSVMEDGASTAGQQLDQVRFSNLLLESIKEVAIFAVDRNGLISTWNAGATRVFGYEAVEALGLMYAAIFPHEFADSGGPARILEAAARDGRFEEEAWRVRKDGQRFWADALVTPLHTDTGEVVGFGVITRDLSTQYEAQRRQRHFVVALDVTSDFVMLADAEWRYEYLNPASRLMFGLSADDDVKTLSFQQVHPAWAARLLLTEALPTAIERGVWSGDSALLSRDGREIPVSQVLVAVRAADGSVEFLASISRDIHDRKHAEAMQQFRIDTGNALAQAIDVSTVEERVAQLAVPTLADVCLVDALQANDTVELVAVAVAPAIADDEFREVLQQVIHRPTPLMRNATVGLNRVLERDDAELVPEVVDAWLSAAIPDEPRLRLTRSYHPHSLMTVPLSARGQRLGAITFLSSVSGRRFSSADLELAQQFATRAALAIDNARLHAMLKQAIRSRDEVLAVVAHDLRNPLNTIGMAAELVREPSVSDEDRARQLDIIHRSVGVADRLIRDLLDVSRIEAGRLELDCAPTQLASLIDEVAAMLRPQAAARTIELDVRLPTGDPVVLADAARLRQVLFNLVGNALKFTDNGGTVSIGADAADDAIQISVTDTGIGIPEDAREHIFDRFWQVKHSVRGGAGLGLAIAKSIVEAHGGRIWVESRAGGGTVFRFTIPLHAKCTPDGK